MNKQIKRICSLLIAVSFTTCVISYFDVYRRVNAYPSDVECHDSIIMKQTIVPEGVTSEINKAIENKRQSNLRLEKYRQEKRKSEYIEQVKRDKLSRYSDEEWEYLYRVARAEAGADSKEGQKNVIYVVLNRVNSNLFPNTITEVIFAPGQFACIPDGSFYRHSIDEFTMLNVEEAILDYQVGISCEGALFFTRGYFNREYLFTDEVEHNFFK